jgi:ERCC4-type nuclease
MKNFYFTIDSREAKLLEVFGQKDNSNNVWSVKPQYSTYVKFGQLPAGDVCFYDATTASSGGIDKPVVLIERKEVRDLSSCIDSGSYKEQKIRMLKFRSDNPGLQLIYLVENFGIAKTSDLSEIVNKSAPPKTQKTIKVLLSAIVSTMLRDNFFVMTTQGFEGTVAFIERIYEKWPDYRSDLAKSVITSTSTGDSTTDVTTTCAEYLKNVKVSKKDNIDPPSWFLTSLAQIPGVSIDKATFIQKVYPNFSSLIDAYKALATTKEREGMLKDLVCGTRKLGPVCSKRVYEFVAI